MENWVNNTAKLVNETDTSIYYTIQSKDPAIAPCEPTILKADVQVIDNNKERTIGHSIQNHQRSLKRISIKQ